MRSKSKKRYEFNVHLNEEDREIIDELIQNNINVSGTFKMFIRQYLEKVKKLNGKEIKQQK